MVIHRRKMETEPGLQAVWQFSRIQMRCFLFFPRPRESLRLLGMTIPSAKQRFIIPDLPTTDDLVPYLRQIDVNQWYSNFGPLACGFEQRFAQAMSRAHNTAIGSFFPVGVASGYQALTVGLRLLGVGPGDKVLVPSVTFPACPLAVSHLGAEAVLSDVDPESWTLTPAIARAAAQKMKLAAVMPVCVYGFPLPADEWDAFTQETGVKVIIDAAAAVESQRYLKHGLVAHSLHALKPFGIGEGGILVTSSQEQVNAIRQNINFGMTNRVTYQTGENAKMSEYHAAVALAQLDRWDGIKQRRNDTMGRYRAALKDSAHINPLHEQAVPSCLMVTIDQSRAAEVCTTLIAQGVAAHRTYLPPLYTHPHFSALQTVDAQGQLVTGAARDAMAGAAKMDSYVLGLPFHPFMSDEEIEEAVTALNECLEQPEDERAEKCA
jgi:dTDP-4-amino-4,6-dideoxygalactose transaminase